MIWIVIVAIIAVLLYYTCITPLCYWKNIGVKQKNPFYIFYTTISELFYRTKDISEAVSVVYNQFPGTRYSGIYQFSTPTLVVKDPELIKQITVKDFDHFTDHRTVFDTDIDPIWTKNLISLKGQVWKDMRGTLSGSFTSSKMKHMFGLMKDASENFVKYFLKKDEDVVEVEMKDIFTRFTNDVIATTAFGVKVDSLEEQDNEFYIMGKEATNFNGLWTLIKFIAFAAFPKLFKVIKITPFPTRVSQFFRTLIKDTIKVREQEGIFRPDMINLLLEARKGNLKHDESSVIDSGFAVVQEHVAKVPKNITDDDITSQSLLFFFAGFDTVSNLMCFLAYELGVNEDIQEKLREEVRQTWSEYKGNVTYEALLKMKYLDMVVSESLRKWPAAIITDRVCTKPYTIEPATNDEKPLHIKKDDLLWLPIFGIHRDPEYYPDPERFDPERFSAENKDNIKPYTYLPFGLGPRNCIGSRFALLETKAVVFYILLNFEIVPTAKTVIPIKLSKKTLSVTAEKGLWFGLKRISTDNTYSKKLNTNLKHII